MTKHDTWVKLKPGNPYESVLDLFPERKIPMRDPFPLERVTVADGEQIALWIVDLDRLSDIQADAIAQIIAHRHGADKSAVAAEAASSGGFSMSHKWVEFMWCGDEGIQRQRRGKGAGGS
jgi:hypothetical protein